MKKTWIFAGLVVAWAIVFLGGPIWAGSRVEQGVDSIIAEFNQNGVVRLEKDGFEKGIFSSKVGLRMSLNPQALGAAAQSLEAKDWVLSFEGEARHGPVVFADGVTLAAGVVQLQPRWTDEQRAWIDENLGGSVPVTMSMKVGLAGGIGLRTHVNAIHLTKDDETVDFKPLNAVFDLSSDGRTADTTLSWEGMEIAAKDGTMSVGPVIVDNKHKQPIPDLWLTSGKASLAGITFATQGNSVNVGEMSVVSSTDITQDMTKVSGKADVRLAFIKVMGQTMAEDIRYVVSVEGLDANSLVTLSKSIREAYAQGGDPQAVQMALAMQMMGTLPQMVRKGLTLRIDELSGKIMGQPVHVSFSVSALEGTDVSKGVMALSTVEAAADLSVPRMLLMMAPNLDAQMIDNLVQQGYLKDEEGVLTCHAEFKNMALTVNGQPVPLPGLPSVEASQP